jgi:hypothetical protein
MNISDLAYKKINENKEKYEMDKEFFNSLNPNIKQTTDTIKKVFDIHNYYFYTMTEYGYHCSACRASVYKRLKTIF